jgi:hypothetical protein
VIENSHRPLVTEAEWEAANAIEGQGPRHTGLAAEVAGLWSLVRCGSCGGTLHVIDRQRPRYTCTAGPGRCTGRGSMGVKQLQDAVDRALAEAVRQRRAELAVVAEQGERHADALNAVEAANGALAEYRDNVELQRLLGMKGWTEGLRVRKEAVELARRALRELGPKPAPVKDVRRLLKDSSRPFIAEVNVYPRAAEHRLAVRWAGAEEPEPVAP